MAGRGPQGAKAGVSCHTKGRSYPPHGLPGRVLQAQALAAAAAPSCTHGRRFAGLGEQPPPLPAQRIPALRGAPQSSPQRASAQPLCPSQEGTGQGPRAGTVGPSWCPQGGGLSSPGAVCGRAPVGSPWAFPSLELSAGPISTQPSWHVAPALFLAFQGKNAHFSSFFLPAMTAAKYFYFRGSRVLAPPSLGPRSCRGSASFARLALQSQTPSSHIQAGTKSCPGCPVTTVGRREVGEVCVRSTGPQQAGALQPRVPGGAGGVGEVGPGAGGSPWDCPENVLHGEGEGGSQEERSWQCGRAGGVYLGGNIWRDLGGGIWRPTPPARGKRQCGTEGR